MSSKEVLKLIKDKQAEFVDLRFTDPKGKLQHLTMDSTIVDQEMLDKLEVGMTESQVKFVMGTPLISDTFYPDRWDYFTSVIQGENTYTNQKITLFFQEDKLIRWEGEIDSLD